MFNLKDKDGVWLKGNLHTHTNASDGDLSPKKVIRLYQQNGYDFLAITDHWLCSKNSKYKNMTVLSGVEYDAASKDGVFHIVGLCLDKRLKLKKQTGEKMLSAQKLIDSINNAGGIAALAHPLWSLETPEQICALNGFVLSEIYNSVSDAPFVNRGYSGCVLDPLAQRYKIFPYLTAVDDSHHYIGEECRGYIMLKAKDNSPEQIKKALLNGDFYASKGGPRILNIERARGGVKIEFTDAKYIYAYTDNPLLNQKYSVSGLYEFTFSFDENSCNFVRFVIEDEQHNPSFSSYIPKKIKNTLNM